MSVLDTRFLTSENHLKTASQRQSEQKIASSDEDYSRHQLQQNNFFSTSEFQVPVGNSRNKESSGKKSSAKSSLKPLQSQFNTARKSKKEEDGEEAKEDLEIKEDQIAEEILREEIDSAMNIFTNA